MELTIDNHAVFADVLNEGGAETIVLLHGAGMDHRMWAGVSPALAAAGRRVLALDMPGHGRSGGSAPVEIVEAAGWIRRFLDAAGLDRVALAGFSMGALTALETAAQAPDRVRSLVLAGVAERMPVHSRLLRTAAADDPAAWDMVASWGHHHPEYAPATKALLAGAGPGVLHAGLGACHRYRRALEAASAVRCPVLLLLAANDRMTPARVALPLAQALTQAGTPVATVLLPDCGHMMMSEASKAAAEAMLPFV
jgi:pimeloyl-ACP methyl ester carboxylesterase